MVKQSRTSAKTKPAARAKATKLADTEWATDLMFDKPESKRPISLRLDADVLRFFRASGAGYQTRINGVLKAFMQARGGPDVVPHRVPKVRRIG